jgi:hypothetical protein
VRSTLTEVTNGDAISAESDSTPLVIESFTAVSSQISELW